VNLEERMRWLEEREKDPEWIAKREEEEARERAENERKAVQFKADLIAAIDIPRRACDALASEYETSALARVRDLEDGILVLSGKAGCGKTVAAARWLLDWVDVAMQKRTALRDSWNRPIQNACPLFTTAIKLSRSDHYDDEKMGRLFTCHRLVLDDLGAEYLDGKGFFMSSLDEVINERYQRRLPMIVTTNLPAEDFKARYGERVADRVREAGVFVSIAESSHRKPHQLRLGERT
jgi:DNA replication protein DnaC